MPVFEISGGEVVPFQRVEAGPDLYESEVEDLWWANLEDLIGVPLFPVRRQAQLPGGGRPDILALGPDGNVFVVEVKRDVDRSQLAQCLEYAGWARRTNLDELAALYHKGSNAFFKEWLGFTESQVPVVVGRLPKLVLAARDFHDRTASALEFLQGYDLPVQLLRVTLYQDSSGRKLVDVQRSSGGNGPTEASATPTRSRSASTSAAAGTASISKQTYGASISDLIEAGHLLADEKIEWPRPQLGETHRAVLAPDGGIVLDDGRRFASPSSAGTAAADVATLPQSGESTSRPLDVAAADVVDLAWRVNDSKLFHPSQQPPRTQTFERLMYTPTRRHARVALYRKRSSRCPWRRW